MNNTGLKRNKNINNKQELIKKIKALKFKTREKFINKYKGTESFYDIKVINDIMYNEKTQVVANFKEYLIYDDNSEFLRKYFNNYEINTKLIKLLDYYENYSKIFPNYIILHEAKYLYKNIQKKQKMIDNIQMYEMNKGKMKIHKDQNVFDTEVYNSILNQTASVYICNKENSQMMKIKKNNQISFDKIENSNDSLERLINKITRAEEGQPSNNDKKNIFNFYNGFSTMSSNKDDVCNHERRTIEVSTINKGIKLDSISKFEIIKKSELRNAGKISDLSNIRSIKEKLADCLKNRYEYNSTINNSSKNSKDKRNIKPEPVLTPPLASSHKATLSMPKLTNNIFYIINQNPQLNTQITIYQNLNNSKNGLSPCTVKDFNRTQQNKKSSVKEKKDYKKLLRPELLNIKDEIKKNPYEIKITKINNKGKLNFVEEYKKEQNTTRNFSRGASILKSTIMSDDNEKNHNKKTIDNSYVAYKLKKREISPILNGNIKPSSNKAKVDYHKTVYNKKIDLSPNDKTEIISKFISKEKNDDSKKKVTDNKLSSSIKGIPIKYFNEAIKVKPTASNPNSERFSSKNSFMKKNFLKK